MKSALRLAVGRCEIRRILGAVKDRIVIGRYATMCGWALARAHAKAGDPAMIAGYVGQSGRLDEALTLYATAYADQVDRDFSAFKKAIRSGHLRTDTDEAGSLEFTL